MSAATFERALVIADIDDQFVLDLAHAGCTPFEVAERVAALSGLTYVRPDDATAWLFNVCGPCVNHSDRPGVTTDHQGRAVCAGCSSGAAALGYEDGDDA